MYTLSYESLANENLTDDQVADLAESAHHDNARNGITGCLFFHRRRFVQILEGEKESVTRLYSKIEVDDRHTQIRVFSRDDVADRSFPTWGMAYCPVDTNPASMKEFDRFRKNLLLLADFSEPANTTGFLFWKRVRLLLSKGRAQ